MKTIIITLLTSSLLIFSCGNSSNEQSEAIELNNGEKWKVDTNMMIHIRDMESDINAFANIEKGDYKLLSEKLQSNIDLLTSNCTMKGKAHDELHKWLLPYIDLVDELANAKDETEAAVQFGNIQTSFITFNKYFQ